MSHYLRAREFHQAVGAPVGDTPSRLTRQRMQLRADLIAEEVGELFGALGGHDETGTARIVNHLRSLASAWISCGSPDIDLAAVVRELVDCHVVLSGTSVEMGIPEDACALEVHRANMAKAGGPTRADGKALKPEGWRPPDLRRIIDSTEVGP